MSDLRTDQGEIQKQIDIIYKVLDAYNHYLGIDSVLAKDITPSMIVELKSKIKDEEANLQQLKDKHPEFFI